MKKFNSIFLIPALFPVLFFLSLTSCKKDKKNDLVDIAESFDKAGMLSNIVENNIATSYEQLKTALDSLQSSTTAFVMNPTLSALIDLQLHFKNAYSSYQYCSVFEFGPAENENFRINLNTFPCDTTQINANRVSGIYDLASAANIDAKGFPAIDFLLFSTGHNQTLAKFLTDSTANTTKDYLVVLVNELKTKTETVLTAWGASGGNYASVFKANTGSDVGGSIGMLVNQLNFDFELLKNAKIGIPLGKKTLGTPLPEKVEAYYSGQSLVLIMEHLKSIENVYLGRSAQNSDGLGLDDYLTHVDAQHSTGPLNTVIKNKFAAAKSKVSAIPESLSQAVLTNATLVDAAYAELQQLVVLLKVDLPSALGVLITYQDNDGD